MPDDSAATAARAEEACQQFESQGGRIHFLRVGPALFNGTGMQYQVLCTPGPDGSAFILAGALPYWGTATARASSCLEQCQRRLASSDPLYRAEAVLAFGVLDYHHEITRVRETVGGAWCQLLDPGAPTTGLAEARSIALGLLAHELSGAGFRIQQTSEERRLTLFSSQIGRSLGRLMPLARFAEAVSQRLGESSSDGARALHDLLLDIHDAAEGGRDGSDRVLQASLRATWLLSRSHSLAPRRHLR